VAVYDHAYRAYTGPLTPERSRFGILPRYAYQEILSRKLFIGFLVLCGVVPAGLAILIYLPHNSTFLETFTQQLGAAGFGIKYDARFFFRWFMVPQSTLCFVMTFLIGPALISADLRNNAMPLYLSRPFSRWDYILGKATILTCLLSLITWVPGLLLFALQAYLEGTGWLEENWRIAVAIFLSSWIYIAVLCLISLAISAYVKWKPLARLGLFGVFMVSGGLAGILNFALRTHWGSVLNVSDMIRIVWTSLFGIESWGRTPVWAAWASLIALCLLSILLLARRIRAYEVVR
jgi:ABC-2 type transport system permease protein